MQDLLVETRVPLSLGRRREVKMQRAARLESIGHFHELLEAAQVTSVTRRGKQVCPMLREWAVTVRQELTAKLP